MRSHGVRRDETANFFRELVGSVKWGGTMMDNLSSPREALALAVRGMASDSRGLKERLGGAYLNFHTLTAEDFPTDLLPAFHKVNALRIKADAIRGNPPEGTVKAALDAMSEKEVREIIEAVVSLYDQVARRQPI